MRPICFLLLLLLLCTPMALPAQGRYPMAAMVSLTPPYSPRLTDYATPGSQQMVVSIVVTDLGVQNLPIKLRLTLESGGITLQTLPTAPLTPLYVDGGTSITLAGDDLAPYLLEQNLVFKGYSRDTYRRTGQLPEGLWRFSVEVVDFRTGRALSAPGRAVAWLAVGKVPLLKFPSEGARMGQAPGTPLSFSWLPGASGTPGAHLMEQYQFALWEMRAPGIAPQVVAANLNPLYTQVVPTVNLVLDPAALMLEPGMKYAWRITASDIQGRIPYEQGGHSEVRTFTYGAVCDSVTALRPAVVGTRATWEWTPGPWHTSFAIEATRTDGTWQRTWEQAHSSVELNGLERNHTYRLRVSGLCGTTGQQAPYTAWSAAAIRPLEPAYDSAHCPNCGCGPLPAPKDLSNLELYRNLKPGDTIVTRTGTTRFIVQTATPTGDGIYKGVFHLWMEVWGGVKFVCAYHDLALNTDKVIMRVQFETVNDPRLMVDVDSIKEAIDAFTDALDQLTADTRIRDTLAIQGTIEQLKVVDGQLIAVIDGQETNLGSTSAMERTMVKDASGQEYVVAPGGRPMGADEFVASGGGKTSMLNKYLAERDKASELTVEFTPHAKQTYGFDQYNPKLPALGKYYPEVSKDYRPAWKGIASLEQDRVQTPAKAGSGISYRTREGLPLAPLPDGTLSITAPPGGQQTSVYAWQQQADTSVLVGRLEVQGLEPHTRKVYLVPVNEAKPTDANQLTTALNLIYAPAATTWQVSTLPGIEIRFPEGRMTHGGSSKVSVYNTDQKEVIAALGHPEPDALYLFYVDNVLSKDGDIGGYMPLQRQFGFIYGAANAKLIAHELAHGAFNLRHPFSEEDYIAAQMTTDNLMDYKPGTHLWLHQWRGIQDPQRVWLSFLEDESEGEGVFGYVFATLVNLTHQSAIKFGKITTIQANASAYAGGLITGAGKSLGITIAADQHGNLAFLFSQEAFAHFDDKGYTTAPPNIYGPDESQVGIKHGSWRVGGTAGLGLTLGLRWDALKHEYVQQLGGIERAFSISPGLPFGFNLINGNPYPRETVIGFELSGGLSAGGGVGGTHTLSYVLACGPSDVPTILCYLKSDNPIEYTVSRTNTVPTITLTCKECAPLVFVQSKDNHFSYLTKQTIVPNE